MADNMKQTQIQADIVELLKLAVDRGASDLLLTAGLPPMLRLHGDWQPTTFDTLTPNLTSRLMYSTMDEKKQRRF